MKVAALALLMTLAADAPPALVKVDATCRNYADTHVLVRNDVWDRVDKSDRKLELCEPALQTAQADLKKLSDHADEMRRAVDELQRQKRVLEDHVTKLESVIAQQQAVCAIQPRISDVAGDVWEWADAPLAFGAGAGMCVGIAFALHQVTQP